MLNHLKQEYVRPRLRAVSIDAYTPVLQTSLGFFIEDPETGEEIGEDE